MSLTRAVHFKTWANLLEARGILPDLVRKLIWARVPQGSKVNIPAYEQTHRPGEDGFVVTTVSDEFVPNGTSVWEMGTNAEKQDKANSDYANRTASTPKDLRRKTTFVFVTPREWQTKDEWAEKKRNDGKWKDVIVIDCNDLEHWIDRSVQVDLWFAEKTGQPSDGFIDLNRRWRDIRGIGSHDLTPDVFLFGRETTAQSLIDLVQGPPSATLLKSASVQDGIDFLSALNSRTGDADPISDQMVVVANENVWQRVSVNLTSICLVVPAWISLSPEDVNRAIASGHHVIIVGQRDGTLADRRIDLPRQNVYELERLLTECGFPVSTARSASLASAGSTAILKRLISESPSSALPEWAEDDHAGQLAVFALIGGWNTCDPDFDDKSPFFGSRPADSLILEDFMGWDHDELTSQVARWSHCDDPLFITYGEVALVSSRESAWHLLGRAVTEPMLKKFVELASFVLGDNDPALGLPASDRWAAAIYGKTHDCSGELRDGIVETLVLMNSIPVYDPAGSRRDFSATVREVVKRLLPDEMDWQRWATFDRQLPVLAESDPDFLLERIERDLKNPTPQIPELFTQCGTGIFEGSYHCGLLWALEVMAWNPKYLARVAAILVDLASRESLLPGNYGNRPSASFRSIFQHWYPGTSATADQRLSFLEQLIRRSKDDSWSCIVELIDEIDSPSDGTQAPRWRTWADGYSQARVDSERRAFVGGLVKLTFDAAGDAPQRWKDVFRKLLMSVSDAATCETIAKLREFADSPDASTPKSELWSEIDDLVRWQQQLDGKSDYKLDESRLAELVSIRDDMTPDDPVYTNEWLFQDPIKLPGYKMSDDFDAYSRELERLQRQALRAIHDRHGTNGIMRLLHHRHRGHSAGWSCGAETLLNVDEVVAMFSVSDDKTRDFASGYVGGQFAVNGLRCLDDFAITTLPIDVATKILTSVQSHRALWDWVEEQTDSELAKSYWSHANPYCRTESVSDVEYCSEKLLANGRPFSACKLLQLKLDDQGPDIDLILRSLELGYGGGHTESSQDLDSYAIQTLTSHLQEQCVDATRLSFIEWGYLPILSTKTSRTRPTTLQKQARNSPAFFITLIQASSAKMVDPAEDREKSELTEFHRRHSRKLLSGLHAVPGEVDSVIDASALSAWLSELKELLTNDDLWESAALAVGNWFAQRCLNGESGELNVVMPVFDVLESTADEAVFDGFCEGIANGRGAIGRSPFAGGDQERAIASNYESLSNQFAATHPQLSGSFEQIARHYSACADREDQDASRRRLKR